MTRSTLTTELDGARHLEEINVVQLMEDITNAVAQVTPTVTVVFETAVTDDGSTVLKYTLKAVA